MRRYREIGRLNEDEIARGCFQHYSATAHTARVSVTLLRGVFGRQNTFKGHLAITVTRTYAQ
jgi:hypothetical protein